MAPREESFWSKYGKKQTPAPVATANRNPLFNRLAKPGPNTPAPTGNGTPPKKQPGMNPLIPAATLGGPPAVGFAIDQINNAQPAATPPPVPPKAPTPPTTPPTGPAATTLPAATAGMDGVTPILGVNPALGPAAVIGATLPTWKDGYDKGSVSEGFKDAPWWAKGAGAAGGLVGSVMGNGREAGNQSRKDTNAALQGIGFLDKDYQVKNADGKTFNFGDDELMGRNLLNDRSYNLDWDDPMTGELVGAVQPLVDAMLPNGNDERARGQAVAKLVNFAKMGGDPLENIKGFYTQGGFADRNSIYGKVTELSQDAERMAPEQRDAYYAAIDKLFGVGGPAAAQTQSAQSSGGSSGGGSSRPPAVAPPPSAPPPGLPPTPVTPDTNFVQAITDTYAHNTSDPVTTLLNPVTAPPFSPSEPSSLDVQPLARRRNNPLLRRRR